jgi:ABC-2 type transport system permease protein
MSAVLTVVRQEIKSAFRERLAIALLVVFLGMTLASAAIGWSSHHTVMSVYNETVLQLGRDVPNPFANVSTLEVVKNTIIYIVLIGALLAVVVGVRAGVRDRKAGVTDLVLSRPVGARSYVAGKLLGLQAWMGIVLVAALAVSWLSVWVISRTPLGIAGTGALVGFFALAWVFLLPFSIMGLIAGSRSRHESTALLVPILIWVAITFAIPQLGTAQNPTALLNPVPSAASTTDLFFKVNHAVLQPISITEHFKHLSGVIMQLRDITSTAWVGDILSVVLVAAFCGSVLLLTTRSSMRRPLYE